MMMSVRHNTVKVKSWNDGILRNEGRKWPKETRVNSDFSISRVDKQVKCACSNEIRAFYITIALLFELAMQPRSRQQLVDLPWRHMFRILLRAFHQWESFADNWWSQLGLIKHRSRITGVKIEGGLSACGFPWSYQVQEGYRSLVQFRSSISERRTISTEIRKNRKD